MEKINKYRKFLKIFQYVGMFVILVVGFVLIYFFGAKTASANNMSITAIIAFGIIALMFVFMIFVLTPMSEKMLKMVIDESLNGLVSDVKHSRKKGFSSETFAKFNIVSEIGNQYSCSDYYSFKYKDLDCESCTITVSNQIKVKRKKHTEKRFLGRVYVIPYTSNCKFTILGKEKPAMNRKKEMEGKGYVEYPLKFKKYFENFEIYYNSEKPSIDMQEFIEKVYNLHMQAKCPVSCIVRKNSIVLAINSNRYYEEVDVKKPVDISLIKGYRRDVQIVLNFIDSLNK